MNKLKTILIALGLVIGGIIPIFPAEPMTANELQELLRMYNYEIQQICEIEIDGECRVSFTNAPTQEKMFEQMNTKIKARPIIDEEYALNRDALIQKYEASLEKESLISKL